MIALIAVVLTLLYACFVLCPGGGFVTAVAVRTERVVITTASGPENTWGIDGLALCVPDDAAAFGASTADAAKGGPCPAGQALLDPPKPYQILRVAAGTRVIADRKDAGTLVILLEGARAEDGGRAGVGELRASARPGAQPVPLGPLLYLRDGPDESPQTFGFLGELVVGAEPRTGADRILLGGKVEAFRNNRLSGERYPVASTQLDVGDKVILGDGRHPARARGFFRVASGDDEGLVLSAQAETSSARIVRFGELDDARGFGYVFSPGWTARLLADPFGLALAALFYLLASFISVLAFLLPGQAGDDDATSARQ